MAADMSPGAKSARTVLVITEQVPLQKKFLETKQDRNLQDVEFCFSGKLDNSLELIEKVKPFAIYIDTTIGSIENIAEFFQKIRQNVSSAATAVVLLTDEDADTRLIPMGGEYGARNVIYFESLDEMLMPITSSILSDTLKPSAMRALINKIDQASAKNALGELDIAALDLYTLFPTEKRACVEYANYCIRRSDWKRAKEVLNKVLKSDPSDLRANNAMVRVLLREHNIDKAVALLNKAELLSPHNVNRMVLLGDVYMEQGKNAEAKSKYQEAMNILPNFREAKQSVAKVKLSEGEINQALTLFSESSTQEEIASYFNDAAIIAVHRNRHDEAKRLYSAALQALQKPKLRAKVIFNVGLSFHKEDKKERALEFFLKAAKEDPDYARPIETLKQLGATQVLAKLNSKTPEPDPLASLEREPPRDMLNFDSSLTILPDGVPSVADMEVEKDLAAGISAGVPKETEDKVAQAMAALAARQAQGTKSPTKTPAGQVKEKPKNQWERWTPGMQAPEGSSEAPEPSPPSPASKQPPKPASQTAQQPHPGQSAQPAQGAKKSSGNAVKTEEPKFLDDD